MVERSTQAAAEAMDGAVIAGDGASLWSGAAIDSRRVNGREIFFALPGERVDGHEYASQAAERGAAAIVVHRDLDPLTAPADTAWVKVPDTYRAMHDLTRAVREQVPERLVAITGSAGKTTTKELLAAMLARRFRVERSPGNLNNLYGFPLSLLNIRDDCQWMVAEMGMSTPGELRQISLLGRPDVAVFTNVRAVHLENFSSVSDIADAKSELLAGLAEGGLIVANADDPEVVRIVERYRAEHTGVRCLFYGYTEPPETPRPAPEITASRPETLGTDELGSRFVLTAGDDRIDVELKVHGSYNVENCLAAAACAHALGVSLEDIAAAVVDFRTAPMRGQVHRVAGLTIVDDCYNSNPDAAVKALASARALTARRYVAVLGDMLELGPEAPSFHAGVGERAAELGFDLVLGVGQLARELARAAAHHGTRSQWFADAGDAAGWAGAAIEHGELEDGDLVLVKGSRGVGLEVVVDALRRQGGEA